MKAARRGERRRILLMDENNENQPAPVEAAAADPVLPEPRQHRPRRRFPRRRYRDRGDRFGGDNSNEPPNVGGDTGVETLDRSASGGREDAEAAPASGEQVQAEPEFGEGIIEISGKGFGFLRDPKRNFVQTPQDIFVT